MIDDISDSISKRIPWCRSERARIFIPMLVLALCFIAGTPPMAETKEGGQSSAQTDFHHLEGRWVRTDGDYILDLQHIGGNGRVWAAYFNPRRINIARAELRIRSNETIRLFIELRDACTYNLLYNPKTDSFIGTYFHAARKQTSEVEFVREK